MPEKLFYFFQTFINSILLFLKFDLESFAIYGADAEKSLPLQYLLDNPLLKSRVKMCS